MGLPWANAALLEQVLAHTRLPMVVFDPNSDFVHLDELVPDAPERDAKDRAGTRRAGRGGRAAAP